MAGVCVSEVPEPANELVAIDVGHGDVSDDEPYRLCGDDLERGGGRVAAGHASAAGLEQAGEQLAGVLLVLDDKNEEAVELDVGDRPGFGHRERGPGGMQARWKANLDRSALIRAGTPRLDCAAVLFDEMAGDRQPESEAAVFPRRAAVRLPEPIEDKRREFCRDADSARHRPRGESIPPRRRT